MQRGRQILNSEGFRITLHRLASQIEENYPITEALHLIGIQERGVVLAERLMDVLLKATPKREINFGKLDITFYRDDFRMRETLLKPTATEIPFEIEAKNILLVDDVLYTGRTIHAAMSALQDLGRVERIELLTMVDRRFNRHLPIKSDYTGMQIDAVDDAYVKVQWSHIDGDDKVMIFSANPNQ